MKTRRVVVVGGGISGLAVAYRLFESSREKQVPLEITVLEKSHRFGGVIETIRRDGFLLESGPDSFVSEKPAVLRLCRSLGLEGQMIETCDRFRSSFILHRKRLARVPEGFFLIAPARVSSWFRIPFLSWRGKVRMAYELFIPPKVHGADESVADFIRRRFGQETLERVGQPMVSGIYSADPARLSLQATMPRFREMELGQGGVIKALWARGRNGITDARASSGPRYSLFLSLEGGMERLISTLIDAMPSVCLTHSALVSELKPGPPWTVSTHEGTRLEAEAVCLALPAHQAQKLLDPVAPDIAPELARIPYESVATVNLAFPRKDVSHPLDGFGFVVPAVEKRKFVGCTFASVKFSGRAPEGSVLFRVFVGGALQREVLELDDSGLEKAVVEELRQILGIRGSPLFVSIRRYASAMPQYPVGHLTRVRALEEKMAHVPGLFLTGNGYRGLGIPDCIEQATQCAERIWAHVL